MVVLGFINAPYTASESDGIATVTFGVIEGTLQSDLVVELSFVNGTASSEIFIPLRIHNYASKNNLF